MYEVMVESSFAAAHRLLNYNGICENQHGHNWKVQIYVRGENLDNAGILIDFKLLNTALSEIIDKLDHTDLNSIKAFDNMSTSSELIARYIYHQMKEKVHNVHKVSVWETDKASATYWE